MKTIVLVTALVAGVALAVAPAEAAKKRKTAGEPRVAVAKSDPSVVRGSNGEEWGRDPDPFIRLMIIRGGRIQDQSGI